MIELAKVWIQLLKIRKGRSFSTAVITKNMDAFQICCIHCWIAQFATAGTISDQIRIDRQICVKMPIGRLEIIDNQSNAEVTLTGTLLARDEIKHNINKQLGWL